MDWKPKALRPEEMTAPVAPPTGESVPIAQGSGLGSSVAYSAVTGVSSRPLAVAPPNPYSNSYAPPSMPFVPPMVNEQEPDIPTAPSHNPKSENNDNDDDNEHNNNNNNNGGEGANNWNVEDLASRFAQLKR